MSNKLEKIPIKLLVTFVFILLSAIVFLVQINKKPTKIIEASWWSPSWSYRKAIPITYSGTALSDFQVSFDIGTSALINDAKMKSDCADIRVTDASGNLLYHWIEENNPGCNSPLGDTKVWTKVNSIPDGGTTIYVYYGNSSATDTQDGNNVFEFFDDFSSFDSDTWTATGSQSITNGKMTITTGAVYSNSTLGNNPQNQIFEAKANYVNGSASYSGICIANSQSTSGNNSTSKALAYNMTEATSAYYLRAWGANGTSASYNIVSNGTLSTPTLGTDYIIGFEFQGTSKINYFHKNLDYSNLSTNNPNGTWNYPYYLWLGFYNGASASTTDIDDIQVDWLRIRQYASTVPSTSPQTEQEKPDSAQIGGVGSTDITPISKKLIAHYKFNQGYGSIAHDTVGDNHGTLGTGSSSPTWTQNGKVGKALSFSTNSYVDIEPDESLSITGDLTLSVWIKPNSISGTHEIIGRQDFTKEYAFGTIDSELYFLFNNAGSNWSSSGANIVANTWQHVLAIRDTTAKTQKYYVNGKFISQNSYSNSIFASSNHTIIGRRSYNSYPFSGLIDEVKIYNYALTESEILQDYNQGAVAVMGQSASDTGSTAPSGSSAQKYCIPGSNDPCSPPIAEWKFDEGVGTTAYDTSGNNNHGVFGSSSASPSWALGQSGNALSFDGNDVATNNTLSYGDSFTFEAWIYPTDTSLAGGFGRTIVASSPSSILYYPIWILVANQQIKVYAYQSNSGTYHLSTFNNIQANTWYHIAVSATKNSSGGKLYINGQLDSTFSAGNQSANNYICLGDLRPGRNLSYKGKIDQVRIYNYIRTPAQIAWDYNRGAPIAWYKLNETEGSTAYDTSGNSHHGTLGTGASSPTWISGKFGNALSFDGNDYLQIGTSGLSATSGSLSAWFNHQDTSVTNEYFFGHRGVVGGDSRIYMGISPTNNLQLYLGNTSITDTNTLTNDQWYHVSLIWNSGVYYLYLNGQQTSTGNYTSLSTIASCATIGSYNNSCNGTLSNFFNGSVDDVRLYNYSLTSDQVKQIYNNGAVSFN